MKVFISSVITGFEEYRDAADAAIKSLRHSATKAEDFGAKDSSAQLACLAGVRDADVVVLVMGERYGATQESGLSATHEEYREARELKPVLVFIHTEETTENEQQEFVEEVQNWQTGSLVAYFSNPEELRNEITGALRDLELSQAVRPFDESEAVQRARDAVPSTSSITHPTLVVSCASGPRQGILRPSQLSDTLADELQQEAMFGSEGIFDRSSATTREITEDWLWLRQSHSELGLNQLGAILMAMPAVTLDPLNRASIPSLIEEDIQQGIGRGLNLITWVLDHIDPQSRLSHAVVVVGLVNANHLGWMTQAEAATHPNSVTIGVSQRNPSLMQLSPPSCRRQALKMRSSEFAEDFTVMLKRERS